MKLNRKKPATKKTLGDIVTEGRKVAPPATHVKPVKRPYDWVLDGE